MIFFKTFITCLLFVISTLTMADNQKTHGDKSPIINDVKGNITIYYGDYKKNEKSNKSTKIIHSKENKVVRVPIGDGYADFSIQSLRYFRKKNVLLINIQYVYPDSASGASFRISSNESIYITDSNANDWKIVSKAHGIPTTKEIKQDSIMNSNGLISMKFKNKENDEKIGESFAFSMRLHFRRLSFLMTSSDISFGDINLTI